MTTPQERARIDWTLQRLHEEFQRLQEAGNVRLHVRSSPVAAQQLKALADELLALSKGDGR